MNKEKPMKKVLHKLLGALTLILVLASCEDLTGLQGLPGKDGANGENGVNGETGPDGDAAPLPPNIEAILSAALAAKTGGGEEPWAVKVSDLDLSDSYTARHIFHGIAAGIDEGGIDLDLSECSGEFYGYNAGISLKDRARYTGLTLPNSLVHINDGTEAYGAFVGFSGLRRISAAGLLRAGDYAFFQCAALENLDLPQVTAIGAYAFCPNSNTGGGTTNNTTLERVDLPRVETIGDWAFFRCIAIAELNLPEVLKIERNAFSGQPNSYNTVLETVDLLNAEYIGTAAFRYCPAISAINLPNAGEILGGAFGNEAAKPNMVLKSVSLPEAAVFGGLEFSYCTALERADLPVATSIGMFQGCTALTTINAPNVTSIGSSGLAGCTALTEETLKVLLSKVTSVGNNAFDDCAFVSLELPSVTRFGQAPFRNCANFATLKLGSTVPETSTGNQNFGIFKNTGSNTVGLTIQVPAAFQDTYTAAGWVDTVANSGTTGTATTWGGNHKEIKIKTY
jgi:hypothetical protein